MPINLSNPTGACVSGAAAARGDGDAAGSQGAPVPAPASPSPCPRGTELRGGDVRGAASPLDHKPQAISKELFLLRGDHKKGCSQGAVPMPGASLEQPWSTEELWGGSSHPRSVAFQLAAKAAPVPTGTPSTVGLGARCPGGRWIPLGLWVVVFLGSQPRCSQQRAGAAPAPVPAAMLRIWGGPPGAALHPQKGPGAKAPPSRGCCGAQRERGWPGGGSRGRAGPPWRGQSSAARPLQPFPRGRPSLGFFRIVLEVLENFADCLNGFN